MKFLLIASMASVASIALAMPLAEPNVGARNVESHINPIVEPRVAQQSYPNGLGMVNALEAQSNGVEGDSDGTTSDYSVERREVNKARGSWGPKDMGWGFKRSIASMFGSGKYSDIKREVNKARGSWGPKDLGWGFKRSIASMFGSGRYSDIKRKA